MHTQAANQESTFPSGEHFDVVIIGAGLSGICTARHLQEKCPQKRFVILEARNAMGGTWDLFRYPGVRSDSDAFTLGYSFKPWKQREAIASASSILEYLKEAARESGIDRHVRYGHQVSRATWSTSDAKWMVEAAVPATGEVVRLQCNFLVACAGYYSYESGYTPELKGRDDFRGEILHPQTWPQDLDYQDKKIIVIGSGATSMTLVPALAEKAAHVVLLQRSPTYVVSLPQVDRIANFLRKILPAKLAHSLTRWKNVLIQQFYYRRMRKYPEEAKKKILDLIRDQLGQDYDVEKHFAPSYNPWDQRLCIVPDNDLFDAIRREKVAMVTDSIEHFTETGIRLQSGETLEADLIVTATGLNLLMLGGMELVVDGEVVDLPQTFTYRGLMFSDVPNLIATYGYVNASWTLRVELIAEYLCRVLRHLEQRGYRQCTPRLREEDQGMLGGPFVDGFTPGYVQRSEHLFPRQGDHAPWTNPQDYSYEKQAFRNDPLEDGALILSNPED